MIWHKRVWLLVGVLVSQQLMAMLADIRKSRTNPTSLACLVLNASDEEKNHLSHESKKQLQDLFAHEHEQCLRNQCLARIAAYGCCCSYLILLGDLVSCRSDDSCWDSCQSDTWASCRILGIVGLVPAVGLSACYLSSRSLDAKAALYDKALKYLRDDSEETVQPNSNNNESLVLPTLHGMIWV